MTEDEARRWPDLMDVVERRVKPERDKNKRETRRKYWWRHGETTPALYKALRGLDCALVCSLHTKELGFARLPSGVVFSHALAVFALSDFASFAMLQSRAHEVWARFFGSSMKDDLRYTPSDCFEAFPFSVSFAPANSAMLKVRRAALEAAGKTYYEFRAALMIRNNEGLTTTYNRFHAPDEHDPEIQKLRDLHEAMDKAVLASYGWDDLPTRCEFLLDYEEDEAEDDEESGKRKRKKPYRYRWPDEVRDEVLARLIDLNQKRAEEEQRQGIAPRQGRARGEDEEESEEA